MSLYGPYICPFSVFTQKRVRQFVKRYGNNIDIKLIFSSLKMGSIFYVKDPIPRGRVWFTSFYVRAVMPTMSAKPLDIYPHVYVSTWLVIGPLTPRRTSMSEQFPYELRIPFRSANNQLGISKNL